MIPRQLHTSARTARVMHNFFVSALSAHWKPHEVRLTQLAQRENLPPFPAAWVLRHGWTRYAPGCPPQPVDEPLEDAIVFDIEKLYKISTFPTLATAASDKAWYGWCSQYICGSDSPEDLIPLNKRNKKMAVIGHNVPYDRMGVETEYERTEASNTAWIDTLGLFTSCYSYPRRVEVDPIDQLTDEFFQGVSPSATPLKMATYNNRRLDVLYSRYGDKKRPLNKDTRKIFSQLDKQPIIDSFQECMNYCAHDVRATHSIFRKFFLRASKMLNPVLMAGMSEMANTKVFVNGEKFAQYIQDCKSKAAELDLIAQAALDDLSQRVQDPKIARASPTSLEVSQHLQITYDSHPVIKHPTEKTLVVQHPDGTFCAIPGSTPRTTSLLTRNFDPLWCSGHLEAKDDITTELVQCTHRTRFWRSTGESLFDETSQSWDDEGVQVIVPKLQCGYDVSWGPWHPFWLGEPQEGDVGFGVEDTFVVPRGYARVEVEIDDSWIKRAVKSQNNAERCSPYLLRLMYERARALYLSFVLVGARERFRQLGIQEWHLISRLKHCVRYLVPVEKEKVAQLALSTMGEWVEAYARSGMGSVEQQGDMLDEEMMQRHWEALELDAPELDGVVVKISNPFAQFKRVWILQKFYEKKTSSR